MKLEELRVEHDTNEASGESIISCLNDKLAQVSDLSDLSDLSDGKCLESLICRHTKTLVRNLLGMT